MVYLTETWILVLLALITCLQSTTGFLNIYLTRAEVKRLLGKFIFFPAEC